MQSVREQPRFSMDTTRVAGFFREALPPLLFGVRVWVSVCLALYIAFKLELNNAFWAGTTAALVCQPHLGASLRKGWFRMLGTIVGAVAMVSITALFPQDRFAFLFALALWGGACALVATLLRNFASYAAALAGFTAAIIASDQLGSVGGPNGDAFMLAIYRSTEIVLGIVCAGVVLAATDFGAARQRLAGLLAALSADIANGISATLKAGSGALSFQSERRDLTRRVIALDPVIDEAIGESAGLRYHSPVLHATVDGLFAALAGWRNLAAVLISLPQSSARREAQFILDQIPPELREMIDKDSPERWLSDPVYLRQHYGSTADALLAAPVTTPATRLLADQTGRALSGIAHALDGLALLLVPPHQSRAGGRHMSLSVPDWLPPFVNAARAFIAISAMAIFWIATAWPGGSAAITWVAVSVIIFAPRSDEAYSFAISFMAGCIVAAVLSSIVEFAILPKINSFPGLCAVLGLYFVPAGALMARWQTPFFVALLANFIPLLSPANEMTYDTVTFYNNALTILVGTGTAAFFFRLLPPIPPEVRTRRLLMLTLRDLRRMATTKKAEDKDRWNSRIFGRLIAMPPAAEPLQRGQLLAALSTGAEIIDLLRFARRAGEDQMLYPALDDLASGDTASATARLNDLDLRLASLQIQNHDFTEILRARSAILAISETLSQHASYFGAKP